MEVLFHVLSEDEASAEEVVLWDGSPGLSFPHEFEYIIPSLTPGRHRFEAEFEFTAPEEAEIPKLVGRHTVVAVHETAKEKTYRLHCAVCLDVRPGGVRVGPTFEAIDRRELIREIKLRSGRGEDFDEKKLLHLPIVELERINGGPWKDSPESSGKSGN